MFLSVTLFSAGPWTRATAATEAEEEVEKLEQLRALWHGDRIAVATAESLPGPGVDTLADLEEVIQIFERRDR